MRVLVCGSRDWTDWECVQCALIDLEDLGEPIEVIHGACPTGADYYTDIVADALGFHVRRFPADWETHGRRAGILRNLAMLDTEPDRVLAFQRNGSRGTQHTITEARKRGIPVEVIT